jgi:hypothetical protein
LGRRGTDYSYPEEDGMSNVGRLFQTSINNVSILTWVVPVPNLAQISYPEENGMNNVGCFETSTDNVGCSKSGTDYSYPEEDGMNNVGRTFETNGTITWVATDVAQIILTQKKME